MVAQHASRVIPWILLPGPDVSQQPASTTAATCRVLQWGSHMWREGEPRNMRVPRALSAAVDGTKSAHYHVAAIIAAMLLLMTGLDECGYRCVISPLPILLIPETLSQLRGRRSLLSEKKKGADRPMVVCCWRGARRWRGRTREDDAFFNLGLSLAQGDNLSMGATWSARCSSNICRDHQLI